MPVLARADLESLLRARKLDRTLTSALPDVHPRDEQALAATGLAEVDARLGGGWPRGHLSELVGTASSGRTTMLVATIAEATRRRELVALVDALDMFDPESAAAAGVDLQRLLWIRGLVVTSPGMCRDQNQRALEQAVKALTLVLQAGNFGLVALDVAGAPPDAIRRLPFTTWLRLQRMVEGTSTAALLVGAEPLARSSAGLTAVVSRQSTVVSQPTVVSRQSAVGSQPTVVSRQSAVVSQRTVASQESSVVSPESSVPASRLFAGIEMSLRVVQARHHHPLVANRHPIRNPESPVAFDVRLSLHAAV